MGVTLSDITCVVQYCSLRTRPCCISHSVNLVGVNISTLFTFASETKSSLFRVWITVNYENKIKR